MRSPAELLDILPPGREHSYPHHLPWGMENTPIGPRLIGLR
jgi:hypothetical protein